MIELFLRIELSALIVGLSVWAGMARCKNNYKSKFEELKDNDEKMLDYIHNHFEL